MNNKLRREKQEENRLRVWKKPRRGEIEENRRGGKMSRSWKEEEKQREEAEKKELKRG